jgi:hypothetical protein
MVRYSATLYAGLYVQKNIINVAYMASDPGTEVIQLARSGELTPIYDDGIHNVKSRHCHDNPNNSMYSFY